MKHIYKILLISTVITFLSAFDTYSYEPCDTNRVCIGRDLRFKVTSGKGAHYLDVINNDLLNKISQTMTVEMWLKPERQSGNLQYICGLWGPSVGKNDSWAVYISSNDSLVFELNGLNNLDSEDNTIVKYPASTLYDTWNHFSFVFNGANGFAYIYINGTPVDSSRNINYPLSRLNRITNDELSIQFGSTNALSNNPNLYRTYKGAMDEIRIWGRALSTDEIYCLKDKALVGIEDSLLLYYRCNDPGNIFTMCDASGHSNIGFARSGLSTEWSDRNDIIKVIVSPLTINDTVFCDSVKYYNFVITDTSVCSTGFYIRNYQGTTDKTVLVYNNREYTLNNWRYIPLTPKTPLTFQIKANLDFIGTINTTLLIRNANACGFGIANIPVSITRKTELSLSNLQIDFDSLKAGCIEKLFIDSTLRICNNTSGTGTARNVTINNITHRLSNIFTVTYPALPRVLKPGECIDVNIRFNSRDVDVYYYDTLKIFSDDKCASVAAIPLMGRVKEVIGLYKTGGNRLDSIDFGKTCINFPSDAVEYSWRNLVEQNITITNISIPPNFIGKPFNFPITLTPNTGYNPNYFRFLPLIKGNFNDSIIFEIKAGGCTIERKVYIKGIGYDAAISFATPSVDFGTVIVGQQSTINVIIRNGSEDPLTTSIYLRRGDPFFLTGARSITVPPNSTRTFPLTFMPSYQGTYSDEVCIYENSCFQSFCIPVSGSTIVQRFAFIPDVMEVLNVLGCETKDSFLEIKNISGTTQTLSNFLLTPPGTPFTLLEPPILPSSVNLNNGESITFKFRYNPNDVVNDRADRAFLNYTTTDNEQWSAKLYGTSVIPKLFLTEEILYETIEVGATRRDTITLENISSFDIYIDSLFISPGFVIINPAIFTGRLLKPRDSIMVIVDFVPTQPQLYQGELTVYSSQPCSSIRKTQLTGRGIIIPLDAPLKVISYGFVKPCDCEVRTIPLINNSYTFAMSIDSVWIDSINVTNPAAQFYNWYSFYSPDSHLPYSIPPRSTDTLSIKFCPRRPFDYNLVDNDGRLHIRASGSGWADEYTTYLAGKQTLLFVSDTGRVIFPPTRVDTMARPQYIHLYIPELRYNPQREPVRIKNITFFSDERVFTASDTLGLPYPLYLDTSGVLTIKIDFKPRAVRYYEAKIQFEIDAPCGYIDTSVTVSGSGFAPAFGLNFNFSPNSRTVDTFRVVYCDTLKIPVYSSRDLPANLIDINCRLGYDTTKLEYIGADSYYLNNPCPNYTPNIIHTFSQFGGSEFLLKNFCQPDSTKPLFTAYFLIKTQGRDTFDITVDSIHFDTEEVILFHLIAESDIAVVIVQKPELTAINSVDFDSVRVLDCAQRTIQLKNTGDVPLNIFSVLNLPKEVKIISSTPQLTDSLIVGDTLSITLEFCPRAKMTLSQWVNTQSNEPCFVADSNQITGIGYAPPFPVRFDISDRFDTIDTVIVQLGDTLTLPIYNEKDFSSFIKGDTFWLEKLNFNTEINYSPFALKFLNVQNLIKSDFSYNFTPGRVVLDYKNTDTLRAGRIAELTFLSVVPDTVITQIRVSANSFSTDSIMFLDIIPSPTNSILISLGDCNLTYLHYNGKPSTLEQNIPNPFDRTTEIGFTIGEKTNVELRIYTSQGILEKTLIDGNEMNPGSYKINLSADGLNTGVYYYTLRTRTDYNSRTLVIIK
ncbi:MAG: choice-of-anchor D domain-containing protein [Bacteroidetes bacterium]|nr:MAG: choice-of-anchor D domain-containing protein [Bacteroidota bacterium]